MRFDSESSADDGGGWPVSDDDQDESVANRQLDVFIKKQ